MPLGCTSVGSLSVCSAPELRCSEGWSTWCLSLSIVTGVCANIEYEGGMETGLQAWLGEELDLMAQRYGPSLLRLYPCATWSVKSRYAVPRSYAVLLTKDTTCSRRRGRSRSGVGILPERNACRKCMSPTVCGIDEVYGTRFELLLSAHVPAYCGRQTVERIIQHIQS